MIKTLLLIFVFFAFVLKGEALEIVYPKTNPAKISANSTFFIGSTNPNDILKINDTEVKLSLLGAFAQVVPLEIGINNFVISSGEKTVNFTIERPKPTISSPISSSLIKYPIMNNFFVMTDNAPLRMTPVDGGINRMSHLSKDIQLLINGENGGFYRVYLNSKLNGWVAKSNVEQKKPEEIDLLPATIIDFNIHEKKDFCLYEIDLLKKVPFVVKEENGLTLQLFNIKADEKFNVEDNTLTLNFPIQKLMGYEAYYEGTKFVLKIRKPQQLNTEKPLTDIIIAIDAGHGGSEFGAIGCCGDKEKDINLAIAKKLQEELKKSGARVVMTRGDDIDVSLADRVKLARDKDAAILISLHANALPDGADPNKNRGTSVYYYHNQAKYLAENILNEMTTQLNTKNDKVRQGSLALVRSTSNVSVLIEVAYIINPDDYALLLDNDFQSNCAKAIVKGIEKYLSN